MTPDLAELELENALLRKRLALALRALAGPDAGGRTLACVGACLGFPTAALEAGALLEFVACGVTVIRGLNELEKQLPGCTCDLCKMAVLARQLLPALPALPIE